VAATLLSASEYLETEEYSPAKREYRAGHVYARPEERNLHHRIAGNILGSVYQRLRGKACELWNSDTKIHIRCSTHDDFYYPDASVVREPNPDFDSYHNRPVVVFEVLSRKTRRIDEVEKKETYLTAPTLQVYALVEQESAKVVVLRRTGNEFIGEVYEGGTQNCLSAKSESNCRWLKSIPTCSLCPSQSRNSLLYIPPA
jgi:Uma2 family endonuclease